MQNVLLSIALLPLPMLFTSGCAAGESEMTTRHDWETILLSAPERSTRTKYDNVRNFDGTTRIDSYRLWRGSYRGIELELYSCVLQQRYYTFTPGGIRYISVVLTAWPENPDSDGVILDERRYRARMVETSRVARDPELKPAYIQDVAAGRLEVQVLDRGGGILAVKLDSLKKPGWDEFDLDALLAQAGMEPTGGSGEIASDSPPEWDRKRFVAAMGERMRQFDTSAERWWEGYPSPRQIRLIDHPKWRDPEAVSELLQTKSPEVVVNTLKFVRLMDYVDPFYLTSLCGIEGDLLQVGQHPDRRVRAAFAELVLRSEHWPNDLDTIETLLSSSDSNVQFAVLRRFIKRNKCPEDRKSVEELAQSDNEAVAEAARDVLKSLP
jgi:hypothetical protein